MIKDIEQSTPQIREVPIPASLQSVRLHAGRLPGSTNSLRLDFQSALETGIEDMMTLLGVDGCAVFGWNQQADRVFVITSWSRNGYLEEEALLSEIACPADHLLLRQVLISQCPQQLTVTQSATFPTDLTFFVDTGLQTLLMVPMKVKDQVVGLVTMMDSQTERVFTNKEIAFIQLWANQVATAIEHNRLHHKLRDEISKRLQIEKELRWVAVRNRAMLDAVPDSMLYLNRDGQLLGYKTGENPGLHAGILQEPCAGKKLRQLFPADLAEVIHKSIDQLLTSGTMQVFEYQLSLSEGTQDFEMRLVASNPDEVLAVIRNISHRKQAERVLRKHADDLAEREAGLMAEMQGVLAVAQSLLSEIDPNNLVGFIVNQAKQLAYADGAVVLLFCEEEQQLEVASPSEGRLHCRPGARLSVQGSLAELAIKNHRAKICNSPQDDENAASILALLEPSKINAFMLVPLTTPKKTTGILLIWHEHKRTFSKADGRLISLFADQAALALHNADLHAQNRRQAIQQERDRLARDLHDSVTQSLYGIGLAAQCALRQLDDEADRSLRNPIEYVHSLSKAALVEMNQQLYHLHPTVINEDLIEGVAKHCELLDRQYEISVEFEYRLTPSLSVDQREALFYITREALWNVVRHARATRARVSLLTEDNQIVVSIQDDGIGFDPTSRKKRERLGLRNMEERATSLGGSFELHSSPGQGTRLLVRIPL